MRAPHRAFSRRLSRGVSLVGVIYNNLRRPWSLTDRELLGHHYTLSASLHATNLRSYPVPASPPRLNSRAVHRCSTCRQDGSREEEVEVGLEEEPRAFARDWPEAV